MKSGINVLTDYHDAPFEKEVVLRCPEEHMQRELRQLSRRQKKNEPAEVLEKGVVAVLSMESALPRFRKAMVPVTVGSGLLDAELEEQLLGHHVGECFEAFVQGEPVKVTVKQASRTVYPEPTDEMAAAYAQEHDEFSGVATVEEYRKKVIERYMEEARRDALGEAMQAVMDYVMTHSDWNFEDGELSEMMEEYKRQISEELREENREYKDLTEQELRQYFGVGSFEEVDKVLQNSAEYSVATALWLGAVHGRDSASMTMDELYELGMDFLEEYVKENMNIREEE